MKLPIPINEVYKLVRKGLTVHKAEIRTMTEFEDLVQITMMKVLESLPKFDSSKGSFSTFVFMQASWVLWRQDLHEKGKGRRKFLTAFSLDRKIEYMDEPIPFVETIAEEKKVDDSWKLELILEQLEPDEVQLLQETTFAGRTVSQVARKKEISQSKLNRKHIKIRKKIRRLLNEGII